MAGQFTVSGATKADIAKIRRRLQFLSSALASSLFQGSYFSVDALIADRGTPKEGWNYYNSSIGQTLTYHKGAWYQYTIDGENGTSVNYEGEFNVAPSDGVTDDAYLDSDDEVVYIYNGVAWEIMSQAGGTIGITYHDSDLDATPDDPEGDGEAEGWHLDATEDVNWLSQKVGAGDWGTPIPCKNLIDGGDALAVAEAAQDAADAAQDTADAAIADIDMPVTTGIVFTDAGAGKVTWTTGNLKYKGTDYTIVAEATGDTNKYIYWNLDGTTTVFATTNTIADATPTAGEPDRWVMCYNDAGTPSQAVPFKIMHGGLIQVDTLTATNLAAISADMGTITAGNISAARITTGDLLADRIVSASLAGVGATGFVPLITDNINIAHSSTSYISAQTTPWLAGTNQTALAVMKIQRTAISANKTGDMYCAIGEWDENGDKTDWANYDALVSDTHDLLLAEGEEDVWYGNISMETALTSGKWYMVYHQSRLDEAGGSQIRARADYNFLETKTLNVDK